MCPISLVMFWLRQISSVWFLPPWFPWIFSSACQADRMPLHSLGWCTEKEQWKHMGTDVHSELLLLPFHDFTLCGVGVKLSIIVHSCPLKSFSTLTLQVCALCSFNIFDTAGCRLHQNEERGAKMTVLQPGSFLRTLVAKNASFSCFSPRFTKMPVRNTTWTKQWTAMECSTVQATSSPIPAHFLLSERGTRWARRVLEPSADASRRFDLHLKPSTFHCQSNLYPPWDQMGSELCLGFWHVISNGFWCSTEFGKANSHQQQVTSRCQTTSQFIGMR